MGKLFIILLGLGSLISTWIILSILIFSDQSEPTVVDIAVSETQTEALALPVGRQVITTWGTAEISATPLLQHQDTKTVAEGEFYKNSSDSARYEIYYDEPSGSITVLLGENPLSVARNLAELQLQQVLRLSPVGLCDLSIRVYVNAAVNEEYARQDNLGLSFCPGAIQL